MIRLPDVVVRTELRCLGPYGPRAVSAQARLDTSERPLALPESQCDKLSRALHAVPLDRYPDPRAIRGCPTVAQRIQHCLRVKAGTGRENDCLVSAIGDWHSARTIQANEGAIQ